MSIKDNLEKAAALFGDSHEPKCVVMTEETKAKIINEPFDISEYQSPSMHEIDQPYIGCMDSELLIIDGKVNKDWAIAIAKQFNLTEKDLKQ